MIQVNKLDGAYSQGFGNGSINGHMLFINVYETLDQLTDNSNYESMAIIGVDPQDIATFDY